MVIEGGDFVDLRQQTLIDLLNVRAGKRTSLRGGESCRNNHDAEQESA